VAALSIKECLMQHHYELPEVGEMSKRHTESYGAGIIAANSLDINVRNLERAMQDEDNTLQLV
jgi:hypothetical protein